MHIVCLACSLMYWWSGQLSPAFLGKSPASMDLHSNCIALLVARIRRHMCASFVEQPAPCRGVWGARLLSLLTLLFALLFLALLLHHQLALHLNLALLCRVMQFKSLCFVMQFKFICRYMCFNVYAYLCDSCLCWFMRYICIPWTYAYICIAKHAYDLCMFMQILMHVYANELCIFMFNAYMRIYAFLCSRKLGENVGQIRGKCGGDPPRGPCSSHHAMHRWARTRRTYRMSGDTWLSNLTLRSLPWTLWVIHEPTLVFTTTVTQLMCTCT